MGNPVLDIQPHSSKSYSHRTYTNAAGAGLTVAFAIDFATAGEKLTHKAAGARYAAIHLGSDALIAARQLYRQLRQHNSCTLNVAGNGIYTLAQHGFDQQLCSSLLHKLSIRPSFGKGAHVFEVAR